MSCKLCKWSYVDIVSQGGEANDRTYSQAAGASGLIAKGFQGRRSGDFRGGRPAQDDILAIDMQGEKQVLGLWIAPTEGAVSWLNIFSELQARGMQDCFSVRRRLEGSSSDYRDDLSPRPGAVVHRAPDSQEPSVRFVEGAQGCGLSAMQDAAQ